MQYNIVKPEQAEQPYQWHLVGKEQPNTCGKRELEAKKITWISQLNVGETAELLLRPLIWHQKDY